MNFFKQVKTVLQEIVKVDPVFSQTYKFAGRKIACDLAFAPGNVELINSYFSLLISRKFIEEL